MEKSIQYQFTPVPEKLNSCLDPNCKSMLFALISLHGLLSNKDGWFYRSNNELQADARLSQNLVKATLDTLYRAGIINVQCPGKGKKHTTNRIHINFESFKRYEKYSFNDIHNNPDLLIDTIPYRDHFVPSYCENIGESVSEIPCEEECEKMTTIIDTIDTTNTLNTSNSIDNILNNIIIEEDPSGVETSIPEGGIELPEVATPVVPKASLPSISVEEPRNSYSTSTDNLTERQLLLDDCLIFFLDYWKEKIDIQLLKNKPQQFLENNEREIEALSQTILIYASMNISKQDVVLYLKDYVERQMLLQEHE